MAKETKREQHLIDSVKTGDVILCSSNTPTATVLRLFTGSLYNHVGVAIRLDDAKNIILDARPDSKLCVMEINTMARHNILTGTVMKGMTLSDFEWVQVRYNQMAVRRMDDSLRQPALIPLIWAFIRRYHGYEFASGLMPFISVWAEYPLSGISRGRNMFCSEKTAYFYDECVGPILAARDGVAYIPGDLQYLFGERTVNAHCLYKPNHYTADGNSKGRIFKGREEMIIYNYTDMLSAVIQLLLITIVIIVIICMLLPESMTGLGSGMKGIVR